LVFFGGNLRGRDRLKDVGINERVILKWIFKKWDWGIDWIDLAQDRSRWQALVNSEMKLWVP